MSSPTEVKSCENCGQAFACGAKAGNCWCFQIPALKNIPMPLGDCLCPNCLNENSVYEENGFVVFKESYHLRRGYCCINNCRHCPYPKAQQ